MNNPLKYVDEDGEFWWIIAAAAIGGVINVISNSGNIHNVGDALGYFGVGAVAGGVGAFTCGIGFGVGGALGGALTGLVSGASSGFLLSGGNALVSGNYSGFWNAALKGMAWGAGTGAILGAGIGAYSAWKNGENLLVGGSNESSILQARHRPDNPTPDKIAEQAPADMGMQSTSMPEMPSNTEISLNSCSTLNRIDSSTQGFNSFRDFKIANGPAGEGLAWHHIVEQTPSNIAKFGPGKIHNINNMIKLTHGAGSHHALISGFYSSKQAFTGGLTVRQWLSSKSYAEQFEFGIKVILMKW